VAGSDFAIISASPEAFLRVRQGRVSTRPIKGTAPRSADPALDARLARELLASAKDRAELAMIVDLLRNDLSRVCRLPSVEMGPFPLLESFAHVHHLVADVWGTLREGIGLAELLRATFPGGSVTGCPKLAAMRLLRELEAAPRMAYTGALGWCAWDGSQADFNLAIRSASIHGDRLRLGVGGGIVWDSDPALEYEETVHKGRALVQCLS
jgi:para-aminobenzoate synthetase component 1